MLSKIWRTADGATVTLSPGFAVVVIGSNHRHAMSRRIPTRHEVLELPLDIGQQAARAKAEEMRPQPAIAEFFLHEDEPVECLLCRTDAAGRLEAHFVSSARTVFADHARHHQADGER